VKARTISELYMATDMPVAEKQGVKPTKEQENCENLHDD
jgi:hypothetical protein